MRSVIDPQRYACIGSRSDLIRATSSKGNNMSTVVRRWTSTLAATTIIATAGVLAPLPALAAPGQPGDRPLAQPVDVEQTDGLNIVGRVDGANRFETAVEISQLTFADAEDADPEFPEFDGTADSVVLARADNFADGLAGVPLAVAENGPLLLTPTETLNEDTAEEIDRVLTPGQTVFVLGGEMAISAEVEQELVTRGYAVERLEGANRFETAVAIAEQISPDPQSVFVTTGTNFPDALSAGPAAVFTGLVVDEDFNFESTGVVVLTDGDEMPAATATYLDTNAGDTAFFAGVGGPAVTALNGDGYMGFTPFVGGNRYETAALVADVFVFEDPEGGDPVGPFSTGMASGLAFPDAMSGGSFSARFFEPLLLTDPSTLPSATRGYLNEFREDIVAVLIYGGPTAVSDDVAGEILGAIR
jgi:hypothetical protein